jgi:hypothetical protein
MRIYPPEEIPLFDMDFFVLNRKLRMIGIRKKRAEKITGMTPKPMVTVDTGSATTPLRARSSTTNSYREDAVSFARLTCVPKDENRK